MVRKRSRKFISGRSRIAIVASRFNEDIAQRLLNGCLEELSHLGLKKKEIAVFWVPGSFEIPLIALKLAGKKNVDAVICLGAVIRGETAHFDYVAQGAAQGIAQASLLTGKPVILGVLTTDTVDQAYKRSQKRGVNKGREAAITAVEMIDLLKQI